MRFRRLIPGAGAATLAVALVAGYNAMDTGGAGVAGTDAALASGTAAAQELAVVTLYKNPNCLCCADWAEHLRENGFRVDIEEGTDLGQVKAKHGVPSGLASCHTALVDGYVIEGHVPADLILQLLRERPHIRGLAVPGMPAGVPGMPDAGANRPPYEVLAIQQDGSTRVYTTR